MTEETRSFGYTADDEEQFSVNMSSRAEEATQYYNPTGREETQTQTYKTAEASKTQAYRPEDAETQIYNPLETTQPAILLDDSDLDNQKDHSYQTILLDDSDDDEEEQSSLPARNNSRLSTLLTQGTSFHTAETSLLDNILSSADSLSNLSHSD